MKRILQKSLIIGFIILLTIGFLPVSFSKETYLVKNFKLVSESLHEMGIAPIESTLSPLALGVNSYFGDSSDLVENTTYIEYDMRTREETVSTRLSNEDIVSIEPTQFQPKEGIQPTYSGHIGNLIGSFDDINIPDPSWVFPPDDRVVVSNSTAYPFSSVVKVYVEAANGTHYIGSGAVIDEFHVLTVAHIAYIHDAGGWVTEMEVIPGKNGPGSQPFGIAYATNIRLYPEWTFEARAEHDWAVVTLDRSIGDLTGWMGVATYSYANSVYFGEVQTAGYPGDLAYGEYMYNTTDHGDGATEYLHDFHLDTYGGQSGSPIWHVNTTGEYIITILAYEILGGMAPNFGTRINTQKYNQLAAWLAEDVSPVKRGDAYVIAAGMSLEPWQEVLKTRTRFVIATDVYNQGTATIESIDVGFYVSKDDEINATDDYFLGSTTITDLQIMESDNADWIGTVPKDVPDGYYYVGWIIDPDNEVDELNKEDNNNGFSWRVNVQSTPLQDFMKTTLGMAIVYGSIAVVVAVPVLLVILAIGKSRRRKKLAMGIQ